MFACKAGLAIVDRVNDSQIGNKTLGGIKSADIGYPSALLSSQAGMLGGGYLVACLQVFSLLSFVKDS